MSRSEIEYTITAVENINYDLNSQARLAHSWLKTEPESKNTWTNLTRKNFTRSSHAKLSCGKRWKPKIWKPKLITHPWNDHQADPLFKFDSLNRGGRLENSYDPDRYAKMERETSTREIKASKIKHLKGRKTGHQIISVMKILPADKGNPTIVMDTEEYSNKLIHPIGNSGYCKLKRTRPWGRKRTCRRSLVRTKVSYHK